MDSKNLYQEIETAIIRWNNDGTKTAGFLTREIMDIIQKADTSFNDSDFMYKWIRKNSGKNEN